MDDVQLTPIITRRLLLRMFCEADFESYFRLWDDPDVMQYLGDGKVMSRQESWRNMAMHVGHWALRGHGMFAVDERASGQLIGRVGFYSPEGWHGVELGWAVGKQFMGRGYATEAARRCIDYAFTELSLDRLVSSIQADNVRSIRVAERLGMHRLEYTVELSGKEHLVYGIDRIQSTSTSMTPRD